MRLTEEEYHKLQERLQRVPANLPEPIKKATTPKPFKLKMQQPSEDDEQAALARYLRLLANRHGFKWTHPPNGGDRDVRVAARLKAHGVSRGYPDVMIHGNPPMFPDSPGCAIELKKRHGGHVSDEQVAWLDHLKQQGWCVTVAYGWEDAKSYLEEIGWAL